MTISKEYETDTSMQQASSRCQIRTEERSTDAERKMISKSEYHGGNSLRRMPAEDDQENGSTNDKADALHREKQQIPLHLSDGMNARR